MAEIKSNFKDEAFVSALTDSLKEKSKKLNLLMIEVKNQITEETTFPGLELALKALNNEEDSVIIICSLNNEWYFTRNRDRKVQAKFNSVRKSNRVGFMLLPARLAVFVSLYELICR